MKCSNRKTHRLGRWISQSLVLAPIVFLLVAGSGCPSLFQSDGQRATRIREAVVGRDGAKDVTGTTPVVVNAYAVLNAGAAKGATSITVGAIADLNQRFTRALAKGDLLLIIQMAGATISSAVTTNAWGAVTDLGNAGHYEFAGVEDVTANQITLTCGLKNDYTGPSGKTQVIRVPQYTTLTIASGASITALPWNGTVGGVVAVHAETTLQLNGKIDVSGQGFRGGAITPNDNAANSGVTTYRSGAEGDGGEKGESIAGDALAYDALNGRYGRGAPANGGGGGDAHNAGGGGGANARHGVAWTGQGLMSAAVTGATGWQYDPAYANGTLSSSEGGGRGGYSYSINNLDATTQAGEPGAAGWGGDSRRSVGGLGGRPLDSSPATQLFLGGGGGAGDGNNAVAGRGGNGGGLVFIIAGTISGTGSILANGEAGGNSQDSTGGGDAAGGGGGGGTVVVHAVSLAGVSISAEGGVGGSQLGTRNDTEGPGGGGGGGYVALSGGTLSPSVKGGLGGTTQHAYLSEFPSNGATSGNDGQGNGDATTFLYCGMKAAANTPNTFIDTYPTDPSGSPRGTFTFSSTEGAVTYECQIDSQSTGGWVACATPYTTPMLADGGHTLYVRATDLSGNTDSTPASQAWTIIAGELDAGVLNTTILTSPPAVSGNPVGTFTFSSNHPPVTYQCRLDSDVEAGWAACTTPFSTAVLPDGPHKFEVRAVDINGNADTSPATWTWTIIAGELDGGVLDTNILTSPPAVSGDPVGTFTFSSNHPPATYQCRLDSDVEAGWAACTTPFSTPVLPDGSHLFEVRSIDINGTVDTSPAFWRWTIIAGQLDGGVLDAGTAPEAEDAIVLLDLADKADLVPDVPVIADTRPPQPGLDGALDQQGDRPVVIVDLGPPMDVADALVVLLDGAAADGLATDTGAASPEVARDASGLPDLGPDAAIAKDDAAPVAQDDAAVPVVNKDAAPAITIEKPVLLGGGFCTVAPSGTSSPAGFALLGLAALALLRRRRSR